MTLTTDQIRGLKNSYKLLKMSEGGSMENNREKRMQNTEDYGLWATLERYMVILATDDQDQC